MTRTPFGQTQAGAEVEKITLSNGVLSVSVLTIGAALQDVRLVSEDKPLTLGGPDVAAYESDFQSFGTIMGPLINRVRNARVPLRETWFTFEPNIPGGHVLHSGAHGVQIKVWDVADVTDNSLSLRLSIGHMDDGLPGNRVITARYYLEGATLRLDITAETDRPSLMSLANHSYWSLDGTPGFVDHTLQVHADRYTVLDADLVATGQTASVTGTAFDFNLPRALSDTDSLDINLCTAQEDQTLRPVAWVTTPTGLALEMASTAPGLQVYDGKNISDAYPGHGGAPYPVRAGLALEAQYWPDAGNNPGFPSIQIDADKPFRQTTEWRFSGPRVTV